MLFLTVSFDIWNDNQHCRYTHALSKSKTLLPRHTLPKTQILFHTHTSAVFGQCCQWTLLKDSRPVPPPALPIPVSSHSLAHFFLSREAPQIHFRGGGVGGLLLAGREHHLLLFNKTEQSSTSLCRTELDMQDQLDLM